MALQSSVNTKQAFGLVGTFYDTSARTVAPYNLKKAAGGTLPTIGCAFTTSASDPKTATIGDGDVFAGILVAPKEYVTSSLAATLELPEGTIGELCTKGHVIVKSETAVSVGYVAAYSKTTGKISAYADAASVPNTHVQIAGASFVYENAAVGEVAILELN